jgi:hypothetical protein
MSMVMMLVPPYRDDLFVVVILGPLTAAPKAHDDELFSWTMGICAWLCCPECL